MTLARLHRILAIGLVFFILPHLAGHLAGLWGQAAFDQTQAMLRPFYRNAVAEPVLLAAISLQTALGLILLRRQWRRGLRGNPAQWQFISGIVLGLFVIQHLVAMGFARWWQGLDTTYWWPASVAGSWPFALYFWPYYFFGVLAFFVHAGIGLSIALRRKGKLAAASGAVKASLLVGVLWSGLILAGISGILHPVALPQEWRDYLAWFLSWL